VNLPKGFQRFGILCNFCAGVSTDLGQGLGLLRVKSLPGVNPKRFGLILGSSGGSNQHGNDSISYCELRI